MRRPLFELPSPQDRLSVRLGYSRTEGAEDARRADDGRSREQVRVCACLGPRRKAMRHLWSRQTSLDVSVQEQRAGQARLDLSCLHGGVQSRTLARNRAKYLEKADRSRGRVRAKNDKRLLAYLLEHPCVDCGETDPLVLDFDHREPSLKSNEVSRMVYHRPWRVVLGEIEKCDVRCANCHRRKTARQFGWSKLEPAPARTIIPDAGVAQLAERDFPKVEVAGSCPVSRSETPSK